MNRDRRSRAWDLKNKKWHYYSVLTMLVDGVERDKFWLENYRRFAIDFIQCDYIGLMDKNGVDIYERDLVSAPYGKENYGCLEVKLGKVIIEMGGGISEEVICFHAISSIGRIQYITKGFEIIGNTCENPELLK